MGSPSMFDFIIETDDSSTSPIEKDFISKRTVCANCAMAFTPTQTLDFVAPMALRDAASARYCCLSCMWSSSFRKKDEAAYGHYQMGSCEDTPVTPGGWSTGSS